MVKIWCSTSMPKICSALITLGREEQSIRKRQKSGYMGVQWDFTNEFIEKFQELFGRLPVGMSTAKAELSKSLPTA